MGPVLNMQTTQLISITIAFGNSCTIPLLRGGAILLSGECIKTYVDFQEQHFHVNVSDCSSFI